MKNKILAQELLRRDKMGWNPELPQALIQPLLIRWTNTNEHVDILGISRHRVKADRHASDYEISNLVTI